MTCPEPRAQHHPQASQQHPSLAKTKAEEARSRSRSRSRSKEDHYRSRQPPHRSTSTPSNHRPQRHHGLVATHGSRCDLSLPSLHARTPQSHNEEIAEEPQAEQPHAGEQGPSDDGDALAAGQGTDALSFSQARGKRVLSFSNQSHIAFRWMLRTEIICRSFLLESSREFQKMAEARTGCIAIISWIWTQVKRPFSYMVESSPDNQVVGNMDVSASLPHLPAVVPLNQETVVVPADQMNEVQVLLEPGSSSCLPSSPDSQVLGDLDASASLPSSLSNSEWKYDVFLSFRGADTRKGITVDIYDGLDRRGIETFMDDSDLKVGDAISPTLRAAIRRSRFAIVVLSQNYASSAWCLEELREVCLSMEDNRILPLFYHVDPTDGRYQKRSFKEAFSRHETSGRYESDKVKQWKDALNKVASISGWNTNDHRTHKDLVDDIVEVLLSKVLPKAIESKGNFQAFDATRQAMEEVIEALKDDEVTAIGVYGMGGVGKTTLVEHVGAQTHRSGIFKHVIVGVLSQKPDLAKIQGTLGDLLGLELKKESEIGRADMLRKEIKRREKMLIILDDIWERTDLSVIGIPSYQELQMCNSKVLLTTRIRNVCHVMECQRMITLSLLSPEDSWTLFSRKARRSFEEREFVDVAKKVAGECGRLPIALIVVARALGDKDLEEWKTAAQELENSRPTNPDDNGEVFKCMKLSYDKLGDQEYKSYFLLCCLFPEDEEIYIEKLFGYAIGKGLFQKADTLQKARNRAKSVVTHLQDSNLLLECENGRFLRMHDVVRDAAIQIAESEDGFLVKAGRGLKHWPRQLPKGCSAISLMRNHIGKLPKNLVCPKLQILSLNINHIEEIPEAFFQSPNKISVLDLSMTSCSVLPQSFGLLADLQALYLDRCKITDTSMLGELKMLDILSMRYTRLKELSKEVGGLTNLRMLDNSDGEIGRIPPEVISKLHDLEELYIQGFWKWGSKVEGEGEETNAGFDEVTSLSKLSVLKVTIPDAECLPKNVEFIPNWVKFDISIGLAGMYHDRSHHDTSIFLELDRISRLPMWFCNEIMKIAEMLHWQGCQRLIDIFVESEQGRLQRLKHLHIDGSERRSIKKVCRIITWVPKKPVFENLEELYLGQLDCAEICAVKFLPPRSLFNLKVLNIAFCYNWGNILLPSTLLERLPNLEKLDIQSTDGGKYMFGFDGLLVVPQLKLKGIVLQHLAIARICVGPAPPAMFQDLQLLSIFNCKLGGSLFTYEVAQYLPQLNRLVLQKCPLLERIVEASNKKAILPKLKQLTLWELPMLYHESATSDIECPSLEELKLSDLPKLSLRHAPPAMFQDLQSLSITDWNLEGSLFTYDVAQCLSQLNCLVLKRCPFLDRIVEASNKSIIFPKLKALTLWQMPVLHCESATFDIVCPSLEMLSLRGCLPPEPWGLRNRRLSHLATISICNVPSRFPPAMFQKLQSLSIEWCKLEGSVFTYDVAQCLSQLNSLKIHQCPLLERIVEASNKKIVFPKPKQLSLEELPMLYYESATFDIECPSLEQFNLENCPKFSASSFDFHSRKQVLPGRWTDDYSHTR